MTADLTDQAFDEWMRSLGAPISSHQATMAVLGCIDSRLVDTRRKGEEAWKALQRVEKVEASLSRGEKILLAIAKTIWRADIDGASIELLGGLDRTNRRKVLMVLMAYYLGGDMPRPAMADPAVTVDPDERI